ncbi:septation protein SepH [Actinokineospora sp. 24-640]
MRALRVVGLADGGKTVICEDPARGERFSLPADERLRAAARGDVTRLGQIEIELESQMRPREIQARIRAGESVDQVAEVAGIPSAKVERFAYPVLLERARTADLAQRAHPVREDGPDLQTLGEVCLHAFTLRGQDYTAATWDSWRGDDGKWIVELCWQAGRSVNRAHWGFHPGAHGGTVSPLDDHAHDLLDPQPTRQLRTVRPVTELAQAALNLDPTLLPSRPEPAALEASSLEVSAVDVAVPDERPVYEPPAERPVAYQTAPVVYQPVSVEPSTAHEPPPVHEPAEPFELAEPAAVPVAESASTESAPGESAPGEPAPIESGPVEPAQIEPAQIEPAQPVPAPVYEHAPAREPAPISASISASGEPDPTEATARSQQDFVEDFELAPPTEPDQEALIEEPARKAEPPRRAKSKKNRPIVPSWEDVLLGTRSNRG